jgi:hypothetical protein
MTGTTDLEVYGGGAIEPVIRPSAAGMVHYGREDIDSWVDVMSDIVRLANTICHTAFVPKAYRDNPPATAAAILAGRELGLPPMTSLRHVQVVEGSPSLGAEYKRARVLAAGHRLDIDEHTTEACQVTGHRRGHKSVTVRYTIADARRAGLVKDRGAYMTRPRRMLFARASTEVVDALFSDLTNGLPTTELLEVGEDGDAPLALDAPPAAPERQRVTAEQAAQRRPQTVASTAEPVDVTPDASPAPSDTPPATAAIPPQQSAGEAPATIGPDSPNSITAPQLKAIWTIFKNVFGYAQAEQDKARDVCARIVDHELSTTTMLSQNEAGSILDRLDEIRREAAEAAAKPRDYLELMTAPQAAQDGADGE